jgi:threonylcarbamoyladenosine tRNA methylthiotransferase MtaB
MNIFFKNFGCKVNQSEVDTLIRGTAAISANITDKPDNADAAVVNTCAVTGGAEKECLKFLLKLKRDNPALIVIAAGCIRSLRGEELAGEGIILSPISEVGKILRGISENFDIKGEPPKQTANKKTRAFIKIQDGCDRYCSYCIIPYLRGSPQSRPADEIIGEARALVAAGYKELVITGINIALYEGLPALLERASNLDGEYRLRLSSLHLDTVQAAVSAAISNNRVVAHFHISLQSGSKRILSLMGRDYEPEEFTKAVNLIRDSFPFAGIGADIITAFPSETEEEFQQTYALLSASGIDYLHVFPYSPRAGTRAAALPGSIESAVKKERVRRLRALGAELRQKGAERLIGRTVTVLTEDGFQGHSENYYLIRTPAHPPNRFVKLTVGEKDVIL